MELAGGLEVILQGYPWLENEDIQALPRLCLKVCREPAGLNLFLLPRESMRLLLHTL